MRDENVDDLEGFGEEEQKDSAAQKMELNLEIAFETITPTRVKTIFEALYKKAEEGHVDAIKLWLAYAVGEPERKVSFGTEVEFEEEDEEGEEWKR